MLMYAQDRLVRVYDVGILRSQNGNSGLRVVAELRSRADIRWVPEAEEPEQSRVPEQATASG